MEVVLTALGAVLVLVALADIFLTVLYARPGAGFITPRLYPLTWRVFRAIGSSKKARGRSLLTFAGPVMMVLTGVVWVTLLLIGFALIYWPALGESILTSSGPTPTDFWSAVYYSGYSLTTLGTGDLVPSNSAQRLLMVLAAGIGFSVLTLSLAYFVSVYSALVRRNSLAQAIHHLTGGTGDPVDLLKGLAPKGSFDRTSSELSALGFGLVDLLESYKAYPVLHYFWMPEPRYSFAKLTYVVLETVTLVHTGLSDEHEEFAQSAAVTMLWSSGRDLLQSSADTFLSKDREAHPEAASESSFEATLRRLAAAGISTAPDRSTAFAEYRMRREQWIATCSAFAEKMAFAWSDIEA